MTKLKITVIGTHHMGRNHINALQQHLSDETVISGVLNSRPETTQAAAKEFGVKGFKNIQAINRTNTDAAVISTPSSTHYEIAKHIPLLIEKPFAETEAQCAELIELSQKNNTPVMIGHTENYNPAVIRLKAELTAPITSVSGIRTSLNGAKNNSQAISELMIHDLAIISALIKEKPQTARVSKDKAYTWGEQAKVTLKYPSDTIVNLTAVNHPKTEIKREMTLIDADKNFWKIEFNQRKLTKNNEILCEGGNSLVNEWKNFISIIRNPSTTQTNTTEAKDVVKLCNDLENHTKKLTINQLIAFLFNKKQKIS